MSNVRKSYIVALLLIVISCAAAADIKHAENGNESSLRWRRHPKKSDIMSESAKKQKQKQQVQSENSKAINRSQLTRSSSYETIAPSDLTTVQANLEAEHIGLHNMPTPARQQNYPPNLGAGMNSQEYLSHLVNPSAYRNFIYPAAITQLESFEQPFTNYVPQQTFPHVLQHIPPYLYANVPNLVENGIVGQQQMEQFSQTILPPEISNNLFDNGPRRESLPNVASGLRRYADQNARPLTLPGYAGIPVRDFMDSPDMSNNGYIFQASHLPQVSALNQLLNIAAPLNMIDNEFGAHAGLVPDF